MKRSKIANKTLVICESHYAVNNGRRECTGCPVAEACDAAGKTIDDLDEWIEHMNKAAEGVNQ